MKCFHFTLTMLMMALLAVMTAPGAQAAKVLHYSFDNATVTSGSVIADESGTSHTATVINNDAITTAGKFGKALQINGKSWLRVTNPASIALGDSNVTVMFWVKTTTASATLFSKDNNGTHVNGDKWLGIRAVTGNNVFHVDHGWVNSVDSGIKVNDGQWHHVVWTQTKDGSGTNEVEKIYIDGVYEKQANFASKVDTATFTLSIGRSCAGGYSSSNYYGLIDEVKIFDTVLDDDALQLEYTSNGIRPNAIRNNVWMNFE